MTTTTTETNQAIVITGDTYPHRKHLKSLGLKWSYPLKGWVGTQADLDKSDHSVPRGCYSQSLSQARNAPCSRCGDYCYGDCLING